MKFTLIKTRLEQNLLTNIKMNKLAFPKRLPDLSILCIQNHFVPTSFLCIEQES